jgi:TRAP-type mannitol/chloroaromatic compound transport system permease small subunit
MSKILSYIDAMSRFIGKAVSALSYFVAAVIIYEIFMRAIFSMPTAWVTESSIFACALIYLLGGAWVLLQDKHVRVDVFYGRFSRRGKAILDSFTYPCFALYILAMLWAASKYTLRSALLLETTMSPWNPPIWPMKIAMVLALVLLFLQGTANFIRNILIVKGRSQ